MGKIIWPLVVTILSQVSASVYAETKAAPATTASRIAISDSSFSHPHDFALSPDGTRLYPDFAVSIKNWTLSNAREKIEKATLVRLDDTHVRPLETFAIL